MPDTSQASKQLAEELERKAQSWVASVEISGGRGFSSPRLAKRKMPRRKQRHRCFSLPCEQDKRR